MNDQLFTMLEQHPYYIPPDELQDFHARNDSSRGINSEMKEVRDNIARLLWESIE